MVAKTRKRKGGVLALTTLEKKIHYAEMSDIIMQNTVNGNRVVHPAGSEMPDNTIAKRILERDTSALSELYDLHSKYIYSIIIYILRDEAEAEDILQEVFLQIWEKIGSYDDSLGNLLAWITRMTRNKSIDRLRSKSFKKRFRETDIEKCFDIFSDPDTSDPERIMSLCQEEILISEALKSLNHNQRVLIIFSYFRGYTQSELAKHFSIPVGTVKTRIRAAMILLRQKLKNLVK